MPEQYLGESQIKLLFMLSALNGHMFLRSASTCCMINFTTTMAAYISGAAMLAIWIVFEHNSALNGILGSLVSITTNCSVVNTPHAGITMLDLRKSLYYQQAAISLCTSSKHTQPKHYIAVATRPIPSVPLAPSDLRNTRVVHLTEEKEVFYIHLYIYAHTRARASCSSPASLPPSSRLCPLCSVPPVCSSTSQIHTLSWFHRKRDLRSSKRKRESGNTEYLCKIRQCTRINTQSYTSTHAYISDS